MLLTAEQEKALRYLLSGRNCFLTGRAGTGKTTVLLAFREKVENVVFLAPTALAAGLLGGETIHRFFGFQPLEVYSPHDLKPLNDDVRIELIMAASVIVIDEVSMLRSDLFGCIDVRLRQCAPPAAAGLPFGGRQIILVGDLFQLPPIVKNSDPSIDAYLEQFGGKYVHQGQLWREAKFCAVALRQVMRQNDPEFISILNQVRYGKIDSALQRKLNGRVFSLDKLPRTVIHLCPTRREVKEINDSELSRFSDPGVLFEADISGYFPEDEYPVDAKLRLHVGERVMFSKNMYSDERCLYKNGMCGTIVALNKKEAHVMTDSKETVVVKKARYSHFSHLLNKDEQGRRVVDIKEDGFFLQIPLKPAYAVTIHKAQGMTLDRVIISPWRCFLPGQLYTALSRCRSLDGIFLTEPIFKTFCDPAIAELYDELEYSPELFLDTLRREQETFSGLLFGVAFPDSGVLYGQAHPLLQVLNEIWNQSLSRQRRGELPNLSDVVSARTASLLELIRSCIRKLRKSGSLDEWEFDRLVHWLLEIAAPDECVA